MWERYENDQAENYSLEVNKISYIKTSLHISIYKHAFSLKLSTHGLVIFFFGYIINVPW